MLFVLIHFFCIDNVDLDPDFAVELTRLCCSRNQIYMRFLNWGFGFVRGCVNLGGSGIFAFVFSFCYLHLICWL